MSLYRLWTGAMGAPTAFLGGPWWLPTKLDLYTPGALDLARQFDEILFDQFD